MTTSRVIDQSGLVDFSRLPMKEQLRNQIDLTKKSNLTKRPSGGKLLFFKGKKYSCTTKWIITLDFFYYISKIKKEKLTPAREKKEN